MSGEIPRVLDRLDRLGCRPIVVASHPRSGTHLCIDTLRLNFPDCSARKSWFERVDRLYLDLDLLSRTPKSRQADLIWNVLRRTPRPVIKTHALPSFSSAFWDHTVGYDQEFIDWLRQRAAWLYVYRDGRPAICSWQHFLLKFDSDASAPISEFLRQRRDGFSRVGGWALHVNRWMADGRAHCLSMRDLLSRSTETVHQMALHIGLRWDGERLQRPPKAGTSLWCRLKRRIVPCPPSTAISAGPGSEQPVNWREAFSRADREFFEEESGGLLVKLGYEQSNNWMMRSAPSVPAHARIRQPLPAESLAEVPAM